MKKILNVEGMRCAHCKNAVEEAVKSLEGVTGATVDLSAKTVTVECSDAVTDAALQEAIEEEGFEIKSY